MNSSKELVYVEEFALRHITGRIVILKNKDNKFFAQVYINELMAQPGEDGFVSQDAAEQWAWDKAYQMDDKVGAGQC